MIIVPKSGAAVDLWVEQQMALARAGLMPPESQLDSPEKFVRAIEGGGNFGLQQEYDAGIQRFRAVVANPGWSPRQAVVLILTPGTGGKPGGLSQYLVAREDAALVEDALRSRVDDYRRARS